MTSTGAALEVDRPAGIDPARVVLPSIFDAYAHPDALLPLALANLLSPHLWELAARVAQAALECMQAEQIRWK